MGIKISLKYHCTFRSTCVSWLLFWNSFSMLVQVFFFRFGGEDTDGEEAKVIR